MCRRGPDAPHPSHRTLGYGGLAWKTSGGITGGGRPKRISKEVAHLKVASQSRRGGAIDRSGECLKMFCWAIHPPFPKKRFYKKLKIYPKQPNCPLQEPAAEFSSWAVQGMNIALKLLRIAFRKLTCSSGYQELYV